MCLGGDLALSHCIFAVILVLQRVAHRQEAATLTKPEGQCVVCSQTMPCGPVPVYDSVKQTDLKGLKVVLCF